tara:strand:- start:63 stop:1160 length:1098 start_codon:yes stop_codon:yes gene_type:complete
MTDEIATANAEADKVSVEKTNISVTDFAQRRIGEMMPKEEPKAEAQQETEEPKAEEVETEEVEQEEVQETTAEETTEVEESEDVLSQLDLDDMSEEDLRELSEKLGSRAVARFGELTAKRKAAEERLAQLESRLREKPNPLQNNKVENNPFSNLDTIEKLQDKAKEVDSIVEWAEDILFESDNYAADDVVTEIEGKELTKADVRKSLLQARKAQKTFLPDQLNTLQVREQGAQMTEAFDKRAKEELSWLEGEDNDLRKQYEATVGDERFKKLKEVLNREAPEIAPQIDYWFAHATNSIYGRKPVVETKASPKLNPPRTGNPASAKSEKSQGRTAKALKELEARFKQTGNAKDFAELRKLKMSARS